MLKGKNVAIISPNCLACLGLKLILINSFSPDSVSIFFNFEAYAARADQALPDFIFLAPNLYILFNEHFRTIKNKLIILIEHASDSLPRQAAIATLDVNLTKEKMLECLEQIFYSRIKCTAILKQGELSAREADVLKLIALGLMNKQIAAELSISQHTVVSHRKNIIKKLGINSISGLTVYAILHGIISASDLQQSPSPLQVIH